ncbi:MAG: (4Fe-4S)-binding protein [Gammaproteobacteria bacterium]
MKVQWDENKCRHAGLCVKSLPSVFKLKAGQFLIESENASGDEINKVIDRCPTGALSLMKQHS